MTTESLYDVNHTIHKLGQHRTLCGDSFDPQAVDALIQHIGKAQLVLTTHRMPSTDHPPASAQTSQTTA